MNYRKWRYGEALLWLAFIALATISLDANGPENSVAVAGLFALSAIGVRATRSVETASPGKTDDK
jgi:hypothetical protein